MKSRFVFVTGLSLALVAGLLVLLTVTTARATSSVVKIMVDAQATGTLKQLPGLGGQTVARLRGVQPVDDPRE